MLVADVRAVPVPDDANTGSRIGMPRDREPSPVHDFCSDLQRRCRESGRDMAGLAREIAISRAQLYAILGGEITRPPDWDGVVRPLLAACGAAPVEIATWRRRHDILVGVVDELRRRPRPARGRGPAQLPADRAGFVGRAAEMAELDRLAETGGPVIVTGIAGVGKTALAVHWAHRAAARFPDGQLHADLRGFAEATEPASPAEVLRDFVDALGVPAGRVPGGVDALAALFRTLTADARMLVVLDNARDAEQVGPLLAGGAGTVTLITSRAQLTPLVAGHGARPLRLDVPDRADALSILSGGTPSPSGDGASGDGAFLDEASGDEAAEAAAAATDIVDACGRLPLALSLIAARALHTGFRPAALLAELGSPLDAGDGAGRVRTVLSWSYRRLDEPTGRMFRRLGLHPGPDLSVDTAAALAGQSAGPTRQALRALAAVSLLTETAPDRYAQHDLIRAYAAELARATDPAADRRAAQIRLLDHITHTAYAAERLLNPARDPIPRPLAAPAGGSEPKTPFDLAEALNWLSTEHAVLIGALRQAADDGLPEYAWQLGWILDTFLAEGHHWHEQGAAWAVAARAAAQMADPRTEALALHALAVVDSRVERFDEAHELMRRAAELTHASGDPLAEGETVYVLSYVCWLQGRTDDATAHAERAAALFAAAGDRRWQGKAENAVGWYRALRGDTAAAMPRYGRALALFEAAGDRHNQALTLDLLGLGELARGRTAAAIGRLDRGLRLARSVGDRPMEGLLLLHLGDAAAAASDPDSADRHWQAAYDLFAAAGHGQAAEAAARLNPAPTRS